MKKIRKLNLVLVLALFFFLLLSVVPNLIVYATAKIILTEGVGITESISTEESTSSTETQPSNVSSGTVGTSETSETASSVVEGSGTLETKESTKESTNSPEISSSIERKPKGLEKTTDSYWLVNSAEQLGTYLSEGKKLFRLGKDIDLGTAGYMLSDGVVIDGNGFRIIYNKGGNYRTGFYLEESNATVTIMNVTFGNIDGSGAVGYYGIVTGNSYYTNMTIIFENVNYFSTSGQPLYNPHGRFLFRGKNYFKQTAGTYSQEWAETNYIEVQSGKTVVDHQTSSTDGFIYSYSVDAANPYQRSSQVVVKKDAAFDVTTNHVFLYNADDFAQNIKVEENGQLSIVQTESSNGTRKRLIYPDLNVSATAKFDFQTNSIIKLGLQLPIQIKRATGSFVLGNKATLNMSVVNGPMFDITAPNQFKMSILNAKIADFSGTTQGTLGLVSNSTSVINLIVQASDRMRIESYANSTNKLGEFEAKTTILNVDGLTYKNYAGDNLSVDKLNLLSSSRRQVFKAIQKPTVLSTEAANLTGVSAKLSVTSNNHGNSATEVKYLLFSSLEDTGILKKAKHIENKTNFSGQDTTGIYTYDHEIKGLNPNTTYWFQAMVTSQDGSSEFSAPLAFSTKTVLKKIAIDNLTHQSVSLTGQFASDTGVWTDFSNGEEQPIKNIPATYGGIYKNSSFEYSKDPQFITYQTAQTITTGNKNQTLNSELTGLKSNTTYFVRTRTTGVSGGESILMDEPLTQFTTGIEEIIDIEIPIEMAFQTKNQDLNTPEAGAIYSQRDDYQVVNKGTVPVKVSVANFQKSNADAEAIQLIKNQNSLVGQDDLNLQLFGIGPTIFHTDLTETIQDNPVLIGNLNTTDQKEFKLDFSGKFFNPLRPARAPKYQMTFKFEKEE